MVCATEQLLKAIDAVERVSGERPSPPTLNRWMHDGIVNKQTGDRVYLEYTRCGKTLKTSVEAVRRFFAALSQPHAVSHRVSDAAEHDRSAKQLIAAGA